MPAQRCHAQPYPPQLPNQPQQHPPPQSVPVHVMPYEPTPDGMYKRRCRALKALVRELEDENNLIAFKIAQSKRKIKAAKEATLARDGASPARPVVPSASYATGVAKAADSRPTVPDFPSVPSQEFEKSTLPPPTPPPPQPATSLPIPQPSTATMIAPPGVFTSTVPSKQPRAKYQSKVRVPAPAPDGPILKSPVKRGRPRSKTVPAGEKPQATPRKGRPSEPSSAARGKTINNHAAGQIADSGEGPSAPGSEVVTLNSTPRIDENEELPSLLRDQAADHHAVPQFDQDGKPASSPTPDAIGTHAAPPIDGVEETLTLPAPQTAKSEIFPTGRAEGERYQPLTTEADGVQLVDDS